MCNSAFGDNFRLQKEIAKSSLQVLLNKVNCSLDTEELIKIIYKFWESPKILKASKEVLSWINRPLCVVSNIDNREIYAALEMHDLHFQHVITSELCKAYKPRKEVFEKSLELLNLAPEEVLFIGDSYLMDVIGAKSAGIPVIWLNRRGKKVTTTDILPDYVIRDLDELSVLIDGENIK
jgi:HAD superfamily hydrolase (TIGR01549 family)